MSNIVPDRNLLFRNEIEVCKEDFFTFIKYVKIRDRKGNIIPFVLKKAQRKVLDELEKNPYLFVLKARQLGSSTLLSVYFFWKSLFTPEFRTIIVAHTSAAVSNIFDIYQFIYKNLPPFLQFKTEKASTHELKFFHGGLIKVSSASSESFRGTTYSALHLSEVAFWKGMEKTVASLFQCATGDNAYIVLETTANGLNSAHNFWQDETNGFNKLFLSWTDEPEYESKDVTFSKPQCLLDYAKEWGLTKIQLNWAAKTLAINCGSSWTTFLQEYAIDPITCFASSGDKFFDAVYPRAEFEPGYCEYDTYTPYRCYAIGVDTASGSINGDYSAFCVMSFDSNGCNPKIAATYCGIDTPISYANRVWRECKKWNATAVIESNANGVTVIEYLRSKEWGKLFTRQNYDVINKVWSETIGWTTTQQTRNLMLSHLQTEINDCGFDVCDERLKYQINTFMFDAKGRPDHAPGTHDDLIIGTALALQGRSQVSVDFYENRPQKPTSMGDAIRVEMITGKSIGELEDNEFFAPSYISDLGL